jgi:hypothetical protein
MSTSIHIDLDISEEVIQHIKSSDGTKYWVYDEYTVHNDGGRGNTIEYALIHNETNAVLRYNTETCLKGIVLWVKNGGAIQELLECDTDHYDHDSIWQYGFFGELVYG